jgi:hypothetical protein
MGRGDDFGISRQPTEKSCPTKKFNLADVVVRPYADGPRGNSCAHTAQNYLYMTSIALLVRKTVLDSPSLASVRVFTRFSVWAQIDSCTQLSLARRYRCDVVFWVSSLSISHYYQLLDAMRSRVGTLAVVHGTHFVQQRRASFTTCDLPCPSCCLMSRHVPLLPPL